jgi:Transglycosylase SLT domain
MSLSPYDPLYNASGTTSNLDPLFLRAQDIVESNEQPSAVSPAGAQGIAQFMPATAATAGQNGTAIDPTNPSQAIPAQARMMDGLISKYTDPTTGQPDVNAALMEYHGGPNRAIWGPLTAAYPGKVAKVYAQLRAANTATDATPALAAPPDYAKEFQQMQTGPDPKPGVAAAPSPDVDPALAKEFQQMQTGPDPTPGPAQPAAPSVEDRMIPRPGPPVTQQEAPTTVLPMFDDYGRAIPNSEGMGQRVPTGVVPPPVGYQPNSIGARIGNWIGDTATDVGNAMASGYHNAQNPLRASGDPIQPSADNPHPNPLTLGPLDYTDRIPYVGPAIHVGNSIIGGALGAGNALFAATQAGVADTGNALSPGLGQDMAATLEGLPEIARGGAAETPAPGVDTLPSRVAAYAKQKWQNTGIPDPIPPTPVVPVERPIAPQGDITSAPSSTPGGAVGADITTAPIAAKTPGQIKTDFMKDVTQTARDRAAGGVDPTVYVPGVQRSQGGIDFNLQGDGADATIASRDEKALAAVSPQQALAQDRLHTENNGVMLDYFNDMAQDANAVEKQEQIRDAIKPDFTGATAVATQNIVDGIQSMLDGPAGKRSAVQTTLNNVLQGLYDKNGNLETDPAQVYGARQNLTDMLSKNGQADANNRTAAGQLMQAKGLFDQELGAAAPTTYPDYMKNWATESKPLDVMNTLQGYLTGPGKITDAQGFLQYNRVQKMIENLTAQKFAKGANPAQSITPGQWTNLFNLRNELAADSYGKSLVRTAGSDSVQQLHDANRLQTGIVKKVGGAAATSLIHLGAGSVFGPLGNVIFSGTKSAWDEAQASRRGEIARQNIQEGYNKLGARLLNPDMSQYVGR